MVNIKTTIGGVVCLLCGVATLIVLLVNPVAQQLSAVVIPVIVTMVAGGIALLNAKDNNVTGGTKEQ